MIARRWLRRLVVLMAAWAVGEMLAESRLPLILERWDCRRRVRRG